MKVSIKCSLKTFNFLEGKFGQGVRLPQKKEPLLDYVYTQLSTRQRSRDKHLSSFDMLTQEFTFEVARQDFINKSFDPSLTTFYEIDSHIRNHFLQSIKELYDGLRNLSNKITIADLYWHVIDVNNLDPDIYKYDAIQKYLNRNDQKMTKQLVRQNTTVL